MARYSNTLTEVFEAYGHDATEALEAFANLDHESWSTYVDAAAEKQYLADYKNYVRSLTRSVDKEALKADAGQVRLFEPTDGAAEFRMRERLRLDGHEYDLASLAGISGAQIIREAAERDLKPALTTINRCKAQFQLAKHIEGESERLGREVAAGEVLGWRTAA